MLAPAALKGSVQKSSLARVLQFHAGKKSVRTVEICDHIRESAVFVPVESPVVAALEIIDTRFARLPTGGCSEDQSRPGHVDERFAVVIPGRVEHAESLCFWPSRTKFRMFTKALSKSGQITRQLPAPGATTTRSPALV